MSAAQFEPEKYHDTCRLPLPDNAPTFGFETARAVGSAIVENFMEDARTAQRWYLAITMGRKSGALALGICKAAGATLAVIPEEFVGEHIALRSRPRCVHQRSGVFSCSMFLRTRAS